MEDPYNAPFLSFYVSDLQLTLNRLLRLGSTLDGPVQFTETGQVAALRSPDGHRIGLFEASSDSGAQLPNLPLTQPRLK